MSVGRSFCVCFVLFDNGEYVNVFQMLGKALSSI